MFIGSKSRFNEFREDFLNDTGVKSEDNPGMYIQYVTARFADQNHKIISDMANELRELQKNVKKL
jgi:arginyl-tRNA synthetase